LPEGPEVKRITVQLNSILSGKAIKNVEILSGRYKTHSAPTGMGQFLALPGEKKIKQISCKGKFIWMEFDGLPDVSIWNTLGMSGSWSRESEEHARIKFSLCDGNYIYFTDIRNFGTMHFVFTKGELQKKLKTLGPDMLSAPPSDADFAKIVKKQKNKTLPEFLMNQKAISGVGNYVKAEALYLAKISPLRTCSSLTEKEIKNLKDSIDKVLSASYNSGGSTIKTYRDVFGNAGNFTSRFLVYGNDADPQGNPVQRTTTKDGRTTFWVPTIQT
jgi:formamidopyrimidine-DNA glycosylase